MRANRMIAVNHLHPQPQPVSSDRVNLVTFPLEWRICGTFVSTWLVVHVELSGVTAAALRGVSITTYDLTLDITT